MAFYSNLHSRLDRGLWKGQISRTVESKKFVLGPNKTIIQYFALCCWKSCILYGNWQKIPKMKINNSARAFFCNKSKQTELVLMGKYNLILNFWSLLEADYKSRKFPEKFKNTDNISSSMFFLWHSYYSIISLISCLVMILLSEWHKFT
jgi:hypothetical protein